MTRIKFVDLPPFQDATKIEARLMATLRRLRKHTRWRMPSRAYLHADWPQPHPPNARMLPSSDRVTDAAGVEWKKYAALIQEEAAERGHEGRFGAGLPRISDGQLLFVQHMVSKMRDDEKGSRIGIVMNGSPLFTGGAGSGESEIRRWLLENDWVEAIIALPTDIFYNTGIQTYIWILSNRKSAARRGKVQLIDASGERFWKSMGKSLGSKRRLIPDDARAEIVRIYGEFLNGHAGYGDVAKIFDTTDFGYREIRVERPLRLRFEVSHDLISALTDENAEGDAAPRLSIRKVFDAFKLKTEDQATYLLLWILGNVGKVWMSRDAFIAGLQDDAKAKGISLPKPTMGAMVSFFGESHEEADICMDAKGNVEPDPKLRDHELVPLKEDWRDYFDREVLPFVPDAWVDQGYTDASDKDVGRVGYEINFNRYFYQYVPPRPLAEIDAELKALEAEIAGLLQEVVA